MNTREFDLMDKAVAIAELVDWFNESPRTENPCSCGQSLQETGVTTTRHKILSCNGCGQSFVRNELTLELEPIFGFAGVPW